MGNSPWAHKEWDTTEHTCTHMQGWRKLTCTHSLCRHRTGGSPLGAGCILGNVSFLSWLQYCPPFLLPSFSLSIYIFLALPNNTWDLKFPDQGSNPSPLHWKCRILTTGPPGKFLSNISYLRDGIAELLSQSERWILFCLGLGFLLRSQLWTQKAFTLLLCWHTPLLS